MSVKSDKKHGFSCGGNFGWDGLWLKNSTLLLSHSLTPGDSPLAGTHTVLSKSCCAAYLSRPKKGRSAKLCVERRAGIAHVHMYVWSLTGLVAGWIRVYLDTWYVFQRTVLLFPSQPPKCYHCTGIVPTLKLLHAWSGCVQAHAFKVLTHCSSTTRDTSYIAGKLTRTHLPNKNCRSSGGRL